MSADLDAETARLTEHRVAAAVEAASRAATAVPVSELTALLPERAPGTATELSAWLAARPGVGRVVDDRVFSPRGPTGPDLFEERQARGRVYLAAAERLGRESFAPLHRWIRFLGVTGSAAYGEPADGDDVDLMAVTSSGTLWLFLALGLLALRRSGRIRPAEGVPRPCLNYVLEDEEARREFGTPRGFLFAREALVTRPMIGGDYYRGLLGRAQWLGRELPRLFSRWSRDGFPELPPPARAGVMVRLANLLLFPFVAGTLQAQSLVRNHRLRRRGEAALCYRVVTGRHRMTIESIRFEELGRVYAPASHPAPRAEVRA